MVLLDRETLHARYFGTRTNRSTVHRWQRRLGFPAPLKVGQRSFWIEAEVEAFFAERAADRDRAQVRAGRGPTPAASSRASR